MSNEITYVPVTSSRKVVDADGIVRKAADGSNVLQYRKTTCPVPESGEALSVFTARLEAAGREDFAARAYFAGATLVACKGLWETGDGAPSDAKVDKYVGEHAGDLLNAAIKESVPMSDFSRWAHTQARAKLTTVGALAAGGESCTAEDAKLIDSAFRKLADGFKSAASARAAARIGTTG